MYVCRYYRTTRHFVILQKGMKKNEILEYVKENTNIHNDFIDCIKERYWNGTK